ncbi:hypothetical protein [Streptomyces sp. NPDC013740]|uniref:hypothetical protein n=1 Tax=Streptomyces sp. NPDC013740 TaxID=3364867 RepID=UPI0036FB1181
MTQPAAEQPRRIPHDDLTSDALDQLYAERDQLAAMSQRHLLRADRYGATLNEVLRLFIHKGHPGEPCLRTSWVPERKVELWRGVYGWSEPSIPCPDCGAPGPESELHLHQEAEQRARADRNEAALAAFRDSVQAITDEARGGIRQQLGDALAALDEQQEQP